MPPYPTFRFPVPAVQANNAFAPAAVDFSKIGQLYDSYADAQNNRMKQDALQADQAAKQAERERTSMARQAVADAFKTEQPDFRKLAQVLSPYDPNQATEFLKLAGQEEDRRNSRAFDEKKFAAEDAHRRESLGVQRSQLVPDAVRQYQFYAKEERAAGREPKSFNDFKRESSAPSFSPYDRAVINADVKRVSEYKDASDTASDLRGNLSELRAARSAAKAKGTWVGPQYASLPDWSDEAKRVASAAENVRLSFVAKTKGAISDSEMRIFGNATPNMAMGHDAADAIIDGMDLAAQRTEERAIFFDSWLRSRGSLDGAQQAWKSFTDRNPILEQKRDGTFILKPENVSSWRQKIGGFGAADSGSTDDAAGGWVDAGGGVRIREKR